MSSWIAQVTKLRAQRSSLTEHLARWIVNSSGFVVNRSSRNVGVCEQREAAGACTWDALKWLGHSSINRRGVETAAMRTCLSSRTKVLNASGSLSAASRMTGAHFKTRRTVSIA